MTRLRIGHRFVRPGNPGREWFRDHYHDFGSLDYGQGERIAEAAFDAGVADRESAAEAAYQRMRSVEAQLSEAKAEIDRLRGVGNGG